MPDKLHRCVLVSSAWAFTLRLAPYATPVLLTEHGSDKTAERTVEALLQLCDELKPLEIENYTVTQKNNNECVPFATLSHQCRGGQSNPADGTLHHCSCNLCACRFDFVHPYQIKRSRMCFFLRSGVRFPKLVVRLVAWSDVASNLRSKAPRFTDSRARFPSGKARRRVTCFDLLYKADAA